MNDIINLQELKNYLQLHEMTVYRLAKRGIIPGFKVGNHWRFKKSIIEKWILKKLDQQAIKCDEGGEVGSE